MTSAEKLADLLVQRHNLKPPVDIKQVLSEYAEVQLIAWPHQHCDGFAILAERPPKVFVRRNSPKRRRRFTMAHELGHVLCYWHRGGQQCDLVSSVDVSRNWEEAEANTFASHVLLPNAFLAPFQQTYVDVPDMLDELATADVSASAGILALRRVLLPGYLFEVPGLDRPVVSAGTSLPQGGATARAARRSGTHRHQGVEVRWFQFGEPRTVRLKPQASEITTQLLVQALTLARPGEDVAKLVQRINGVVGGTLARARSASSPEALLGALHQKFLNDHSYADLMAYPDFCSYLEQKASDLGKRRHDKPGGD